MGRINAAESKKRKNVVRKEIESVWGQQQAAARKVKKAAAATKTKRRKSTGLV